jgi:prolyl oligopeptidase
MTMQQSKRRLPYPDTRIDDVQDTLTSVSFPDPYRWLELDNEEVRRWQRAQAELASSHVREWRHFDRLRRLIARFSTERRVVLPRFAAGRWFRTHIPEGASQAQALVADEPMGDGRVLFDSMSESRDRPPFLSWIAPSPDGHTLALGLCADGSESNTIRLIDVATGRALADPPLQRLMDNWTGGVQWLPDSSGFFFSVITGAAIDFVQEVYLHLRTPAPTTLPVDIAWTAAKEWRMVVVSCDGQYAVALERLRNPIPVAIVALGKGSLRWRPFVTSIGGTVAGHLVGDRYIAVTDVCAPRGRLVAIPLDAQDPNDPANWQELLAESDATLRTVTPVGEALYLTEFVDTYARIRVVDLDGKALGEVPLPGRGAVSELPFPMMNLVQRGHPEKFLFAFSSLTVGWGIYIHTPGESRIRTLREPKVQLDNAVVEDRWAVSADGTRIPYHIVRRAEVSATHAQPTLIWAYGGFNVPEVPQFPGPMAAFVAVGGVFVHAHLRGGAEFGFEWWEGGRMRNKQNCYDDLFAVAEDLIAAGFCTPQSLAVTGGSNGGLMAGVAATQRPDLWKVVVPRVPILDLVGACREPYGRLVVMMEYANVEDSEEVRRLATFSPYYLVRDGVDYPAIFIDAGGTDPRCPPWHARKFAARLQRANSGSTPILLHVWENVGHGWATDKNIALTEHTEWLAFTLRHLGVELLPEK